MITRTTRRYSEKMNPERWDRLKTILSDALEQDTTEARVAVLEKACGHDTDLRAEAESLLTAAEELANEPTDRFEDCVQNAAVTYWPEETQRVGERLGAYLIRRELGRGGMGAVYLAERADGRFEKEVAIKVLKRGTDTDDVVHRFASERLILARLEHPNIAHLLDAGTTDDGLPYFVMEYVAGAPVTRYVREHQLTIEERLTLFLKISAAVEMAHHKHVIHRDLKPSNILVNEEGEPKLLDFGIAKLLMPGQSEVELTAAGEQRLTPIYASPEQTDGRPVTEASDVYALGALLYEMLSGRKPHQFASVFPTREEIARVVREQEPAFPSAGAREPETARRLRGDLDAIVLKALRKEPAMRYPKAAELAEDIRRHLRLEPVLARGPGVGYRARVFLARHHAGRSVLAGAAVLLLLAVSAFVFWKLSPSPSGQPASTALPNETSPADFSKSIAVMPFDDFGSDNSSYFADGVQDNILTDLAKVEDLKVISRNAMAHYRGKARNAREIGRELGVGNLLVGSVQKSGDRVRINAQLIDTRTDAQIWAEHYDRKIEDIFALQSELAQTIVAQLKATLSSGEQAAIWKRPTEDLQAYDLYMQADAIYSASAGTDPKSEWNEVVRLVQAAIERDPKFTRAYCLLNRAQLLIYRFGYDHTPERLASAKGAAEAALRLEPNLEEARLALARYYYDGLYDYRRTEEELAKIPSSRVHSVNFFTLSSLVQRRLAKWDDAIRNGERAVELDPQNIELAVSLVQTYSGLRRYRDSNRVIDAATERAPGRAGPRLVMVKNEAAIAVGDLAGARAALATYPDAKGMDYEGARLWLCFLERDYAGARREAANAGPELKAMPTFWLSLAGVAQAEGNLEDARQSYAEAKRLGEEMLAKRPNDSETLGELAAANAGLGLKEEALQLARRGVTICPPETDALLGPRSLMRLGEVQAVTGDTDAAFETLTRLASLPFGLTYGDLKLDPMWDLLRYDPRFPRLLAALAPSASAR